MFKKKVSFIIFFSIITVFIVSQQQTYATACGASGNGGSSGVCSSSPIAGDSCTGPGAGVCGAGSYCCSPGQGSGTQNGCPVGQTTPHNSCQGGKCTSISGCGQSSCYPAGSTTVCGGTGAGTSTTATGAKTTTGSTAGGGTAAGATANGAPVVPPPPACVIPLSKAYDECENNSNLGCYSQFPPQNGVFQSVHVQPNGGPNCNMTQCTAGGNACQGATTITSAAAPGTAGNISVGGLCNNGKGSCETTSCIPGQTSSGRDICGIGLVCCTAPQGNQTQAMPPGSGCQNNTGTCAPTSLACGPNSTGTVTDNTCSTGTCCLGLQQTGGGAVGTFGLRISAHLEGMGKGTTADGTPENGNPTQKTVTAELYVLPSQLKPRQAAAVGSLTYNAATGLFENRQFPIGKNVPGGAYKVILHVNGYIDRELMNTDGTQQVVMSPEYTSTTGTVDMTPGDIAPTGGDNIVDIQDYNMMVGCMGQTSVTTCTNPKGADLNGDGMVDQKDLNILLSHFGAPGASFTMQQFVCTQDPTCAKGNTTIQMCPLQCKIETIPVK